MTQEGIRRLLTALAALLATGAALVVPGVYYLTEYAALESALEANAQSEALEITRFINRSPETWRIQENLLSEVLHHPSAELAVIRVLAGDGRTVVQTAEPPPAPRIVRVAALLDSGESVGAVEASVSLRPLLGRSVLLGGVGFVLGMGMYVLVRRFAVRAIDQAFTRARQQTALAETALAERAGAEERLRQLNVDLERRTTELAYALDALTDADRMKSDFMASVTHELRTPLNSVIGFAEMLKDEVPGPLNATQAGFAADILASGLYLLKLVEGVLEMSRLDMGGIAPAREPVAIGAALEECVAAHRAAAGARGVSLVLEGAAGAGSTELDPAALRLNLDALIDNAIKFNRAGGTVTVRVSRTDGALEIAVADTGVGIAQCDLQRLFKPFAQLDAGLARQHGGIGMGLALALRLARLQGGTIEAESEPGKGSTFTLRLPETEVARAAAVASVARRESMTREDTQA